MIHIRLAIDAILIQFKKFTLTVLLVAVSLIVFIFAIVLYQTQAHGYNSFDEILKYGVEQTGILQMDEGGYEDSNVRGFIDEAKTLEEIACIGTMGTFSTSRLSELYEIQRNTTGEYFKPVEGYLNILTIDINCLGICELRLEEGIEPDKLDFNISTEEHTIYYLYLGSDFSTIPVGTKYVTEYATYVVAGIMEEGQRWLNPDCRGEFSNEDWDYTIDCDNAVFEVTNFGVVSSNVWISAAEGYTIEEAIEAAYTLEDKYQLTMLYATLADRYEQSCADTILMLSYLGKAFGIIIPAVMLMLVTMQIVAMLLELKDYGVMYANGFSVKDMSLILIIKNLITGLTAFLIAAPVSVWLESQWFYKNIQYIIKNIMLTHALPYAIIMLLIVTLITSVTAVGMLRRYMPVELMRKQN